MCLIHILSVTDMLSFLLRLLARQLYRIVGLLVCILNIQTLLQESVP